MASRRLWQVDVTAAAARDFQQALIWTREKFGEQQAGIYEQTLLLSLEFLTRGPGAAGVRSRGDLSEDLMSLHVARRGRRGRHVIFFRLEVSEPFVMRVVRILHDAMDFARHLSAKDADRTA